MAAPTSNRRIYRFGVFELDTRAAELRKSGTRIKLQSQPLKVLTTSPGLSSRVTSGGTNVAIGGEFSAWPLW